VVACKYCGETRLFESEKVTQECYRCIHARQVKINDLLENVRIASWKYHQSSAQEVSMKMRAVEQLSGRRYGSHKDPGHLGLIGAIA